MYFSLSQVTTLLPVQGGYGRSMPASMEKEDLPPPPTHLPPPTRPTSYSLMQYSGSLEILPVCTYVCSSELLYHIQTLHHDQLLVSYSIADYYNQTVIIITALYSVCKLCCGSRESLTVQEVLPLRIYVPTWVHEVRMFTFPSLVQTFKFHIQN